jgi:hypothetical protein
MRGDNVADVEGLGHIAVACQTGIDAWMKFRATMKR